MTGTVILLGLLIGQATCIVSAEESEWGEIINVNHEYNIAFTDLSSLELDIGDVVDVYKEGKFLTYLKVAKTSSAISKLVPIKKRGVLETKIDFEEITVGCTVKRSESNEKEEEFTQQEPKRVNKRRQGLEVQKTQVPVSTEQSNLEKQIQLLSQNYSLLSESLSEILKEKKIIEENLTIVNRQLNADKESTAVLQKENQDLRSKVSELEKNDCKEEVRECEQIITNLKESISLLKVRLKNMAEMIREN